MSTFQISGRAKEAIRLGTVKIKVLRSGMYQNITFSVKKVSIGNVSYSELYTDRIIDASEISRISNEVGLPVEAPNGKAYPKGTSANDFSNL